MNATILDFPVKTENPFPACLELPPETAPYFSANQAYALYRLLSGLAGLPEGQADVIRRALAPSTATGCAVILDPAPLQVFS
jgi:hypothetical protein